MVFQTQFVGEARREGLLRWPYLVIYALLAFVIWQGLVSWRGSFAFSQEIGSFPCIRLLCRMPAAT